MENKVFTIEDICNELHDLNKHLSKISRELEIANELRSVESVNLDSKLTTLRQSDRKKGS